MTQLLVRLCLGLSYLTRGCKLEPDSTFHFLLHYDLLELERKALLDEIKETNVNIINENND